MQKYSDITPSQAIEIGKTLIDGIIKGLENIGFRKKTRERLNALEEVVVMQEKRIEELEKKA